MPGPDRRRKFHRIASTTPARKIGIPRIKQIIKRLEKEQAKRLKIYHKTQTRWKWHRVTAIKELLEHWHNALLAKQKD